MELDFAAFLVLCFLFNREDREARFLASKMSIVASFRSWAGKHVSILSYKNTKSELWFQRMQVAS